MSLKLRSRIVLELTIYLQHRCTIGYGDVTPTTPVSQFFAVSLVFCSTFLVFSISKVVVTFMINEQINKVNRKITKQIDVSIVKNAFSNSDNKSLALKCNAVCRACGLFWMAALAPLVYLILYLIWLLIWVLYFDSDEYDFWQSLYFGIVTSSTVGYGVFLCVFLCLFFVNNTHQILPGLANSVGTCVFVPQVIFLPRATIANCL